MIDDDRPFAAAFPVDVDEVVCFFFGPFRMRERFFVGLFVVLRHFWLDVVATEFVVIW